MTTRSPSHAACACMDFCVVSVPHRAQAISTMLTCCIVAPGIIRAGEGASYYKIDAALIPRTGKPPPPPVALCFSQGVAVVMNGSTGRFTLTATHSCTVAPWRRLRATPGGKSTSGTAARQGLRSGRRRGFRERAGPTAASIFCCSKASSAWRRCFELSV